METIHSYKSFNEKKSIEELKYNMLQYRIRLEEIILENNFYKNLLVASIYKSNTINLFENLEQFKRNLNKIETAVSELVPEINSHSHSITNKTECDDLFCDNFFIKTHDDLEEKIYQFFLKSRAFKRQMLQYLESVLKKNN